MRIPTIGSALLALAFAMPVEAQEQADGVPPPPENAEGEPLSDLELIRWASNELRVQEGRSLRPPWPAVAPDSYLGSSVDGPLTLPGEGDRDPVRLLAELGGGTLGIVVGGGVGMLVVWAALDARANPDWMMVAVGASTTLAALAVTGGVVLAADAAGGRGNFGHAFIGQLVGSFAALPLVVMGMASDAPVLALVAAGILPLAGAMLGYEISHADRSDGASWAPRSGIVFVSPIEGGALAGVAGELL